MENHGKYDYQYVLTEEMVRQRDSSQCMILRQVQPSSIVLECGSADGIMTRYLKEALHCQITILEYDSGSFAHARLYADDGICADLETDEWMSCLPDSSFDYILYADVLEHLRDPLAVLAKMRRFLKPDGKVLLSVPNIAHGDIIMNLLCDQFTYTQTGLLDDTHIHFFARNDLKKLVASSGYFLARESCTLANLFFSESGVFLPQEKRPALKQALAEHPTSRVYQYVCCLTQTETETVSDVDERVELDARFYFDFGAGFSEVNCITARSSILPDGAQCYTADLPEGCINVRFDPEEEFPCILTDLAAVADGTPLSVTPLNGQMDGPNMFFFNDDPQVLIELPHGMKTLRVTTVRTLMGVNETVAGVLRQFEAKKKSEQIHAAVELQAEQMRRENAEAERQAEQMRRENAEAERQAEQTRRENAEAERQAEQTRRENAEAEQQAEQTRRENAEAERQAEQTRRENAEAERQAEQMRRENAEAELSIQTQELSNLYNGRFWKITRPLRWLLAVIKRIVG